MPIPTPGFIATSAVYPSKFVVLDPANNFQVLQATANQRLIGVSFEGTEQPPLPGFTYPLPAAGAGEPLAVYTQGQSPVLLTAGAAITAGDHLVSDINGNGVPMTTSGYPQNIGAIALESCPSGGLVRVQVTLYETISTTT